MSSRIHALHHRGHIGLRAVLSEDHGRVDDLLRVLAGGLELLVGTATFSIDYTVTGNISGVNAAGGALFASLAVILST